MKKKKKKSKKVTYAMFHQTLVTSVIGILACMMCLVGLTWAWFSGETVTGVSVLKAANFDLSVSVTDEDSASISEVNGSYELDSSKIYTFSLQPLNVTATASKGFYLVALTKEGSSAASTYYTVKFSKETVFTFNVTGFAKVTLTPMWGELPSGIADVYMIEQGETVAPISMMSAPPVTPVPEEKEEKEEPTSSETSSEATSSESAESTSSKEKTASEDTSTSSEQAPSEQSTSSESVSSQVSSGEESSTVSSMTQSTESETKTSSAVSSAE